MRCESERGAFVTVIKKGAQQAGAVFVVQVLDNGNVDVFGPAPQSILSGEDGDRQFERVLSNASQQEADGYLDRQSRFDPDLWIVETQSGLDKISLEVIS